jgi:hypothetical protein
MLGQMNRSQKSPECDEVLEGRANSLAWHEVNDRVRRASGALLCGAALIACGGGTDFETAVQDASVDTPKSDAHRSDTRSQDTGSQNDTGKRTDAKPRGDAEPNADAAAETGRGEAGEHDSGPDGVTTGEAGMGCAANEPACSLAVPCTATKFPQCETLTCQSGCCASMKATAGTSCSEGGGKVCDGSGACVACTVDANCTTTGTTCAVATCNSSHACGVTTAPLDQQCSDHGGSVCNGAGQCVECTSMDKTACSGTTPYCGTAGTCVQCLTTADCNSGLQSCNGGKCVGL